MIEAMNEQSSQALMKQRRRGVLISAGLLTAMVLGIYVLSMFLLRTGAGL